jgi:hypothetical protein
MTRKALVRRIAEPYLTSQQRGEAPAPPQSEGLRGFWPGALLLVSQRPQRVFSFLASRTQPKFAAALLYEPQIWCTRACRAVGGVKKCEATLGPDSVERMHSSVVGAKSL